MKAQKTRTILLALCGLALAACGQQTPPAAAPETAAVEEAALLSQEELDARRVADLVALNNAVQAYHTQNGSYPVSPAQGFTNVVDGGENWIPGLAPTFIQALPRDPALAADAGHQYWYASSGEDYKLLVHGVSGQCGQQIERDGIRIDPKRVQNGQCWAYGFWTDGYRNR